MSIAVLVMSGANLFGYRKCEGGMFLILIILDHNSKVKGFMISQAVNHMSADQMGQVAKVAMR
jgi:hypothetical protein